MFPWQVTSNHRHHNLRLIPEPSSINTFNFQHFASSLHDRLTIYAAHFNSTLNLIAHLTLSIGLHILDLTLIANPNFNPFLPSAGETPKPKSAAPTEPKD